MEFNVKFIYNPDYLTRNNNGSIWVAKDIIKNTYICSSDNYFSENPFDTDVEGAYYSAQYSDNSFLFLANKHTFLEAITQYPNLFI